MKKFLALALALSCASANIIAEGSYTREELKDLEKATAHANVALQSLQTILGTNSIGRAGDLSNKGANLLNKVLAYAVEDQSFVARITRILEAVSTNITGENGAAETKLDCKTGSARYSMVVTEAITHEVASYFEGKLIGTLVGSGEESRIVRRALDIVAQSSIHALISASFEAAGAKCPLLNGTAANSGVVGFMVNKDAEFTKSFQTNFTQNLIQEIAFNIAGELVISGAKDFHAGYWKSVQRSLRAITGGNSDDCSTKVRSADICPGSDCATECTEEVAA